MLASSADDAATMQQTRGPVTAMAITADGQHGLIATDKSSPALCRVGDLVRPFGPSKLGPNAGCLEFVRSVPIAPEFKIIAADARGEQLLTASASRIVV
jgi:hypothetical protein